MTAETPPKAGIYVHVPFCRKKCRYCDFYSVADSGRREAFCKALLQEMASAEMPDRPADTLYLGGGTPSLLPSAAVGRIIDEAGLRLGLLPHSEITLEVNPGTVDLAKLQAFRRYGVNRLNIGVQSFDDLRLAFLGRIHSAREARTCIQAAREAGFDNLGIDLIYGLPGQTESDWEKDLEQAVAQNPEHLSCYILTYEPETPLGRDLKNGRVRPLEEGRVRDLFHLTRDFLSAGGYAQYEISNFARSADYRSRHNCKYWALTPYIGLGPSAHSFGVRPPARWWNPASLEAYLQAIGNGRCPRAGFERLTREQQMIEAVYLGLRQTCGINTKDFENRFGIGFFKQFSGPIDDLTKAGLLCVTAGSCALTPMGMALMDSIVARLVEEV